MGNQCGPSSFLGLDCAFFSKVILRNDLTGFLGRSFLGARASGKLLSTVFQEETSLRGCELKTYPKRPFSELPHLAQKRLMTFAEDLRRVAGSRLHSIVVHGSAVRGGYRGEQSDIDVLVVLTETSLELLEALSNPLMLARNASRIDAMILKPSEIEDAADVFPVFYADIRRCHAIVEGEDPFETLEIPEENIRVRIEQELRETKIRLRRAVVDGLCSPGLLAGALARKLKQVRGPLFALQELLGIAPKQDSLEEVLGVCAGRYGIDVAPLLDPGRDSRKGHGVFRKLMDAAIADADRFGKDTGK